MPNSVNKPLTLILPEAILDKPKRAHGILEATPTKHRIGYDPNFEKWLELIIMKVDMPKARVENVYNLLASGLSPKEIRNILNEVDGIRTEEGKLLNKVCSLVNQGRYTLDQIKEAIRDRHWNNRDEGQRLEDDIDRFHKKK